MEKTFRRLLSQIEYRNAYAEAGAATHLAHQIRVLRTQRGWSQADLARRLGTTQGVVSRLEDPGYGRVSFKTLVSVARVFDVLPVMGFASITKGLRERWAPRRAALEVEPFAAEAQRVVFITPITTASSVPFTHTTAPAGAALQGPQSWHTVATVVPKPQRQPS